MVVVNKSIVFRYSCVSILDWCCFVRVIIWWLIFVVIVVRLVSEIMSNLIRMVNVVIWFIVLLRSVKSVV